MQVSISLNQFQFFAYKMSPEFLINMVAMYQLVQGEIIKGSWLEEWAISINSINQG